MTGNKKYKPPIELLVLYTVGSLFVGLGLFELFAETEIVPDQYKFENYELTMVVVGALLMLPKLLNMMSHYFGKKDRPGDYVIDAVISIMSQKQWQLLGDEPAAFLVQHERLDKS